MAGYYRRKIVTGMGILTLLLSLTGCSVGETAEQMGDSAKQEQVSEDNKTGKTVGSGYTEPEQYIGDLGKTPDEMGITLDPYEYSVEVRGALFGKGVHGYLGFYEENASGESILSSIDLYSDDCGFRECYDQFADRFGGPVSSGMEPYVAVNGGALEWYHFDAGKAIAGLSMGSENNYINISFTINDDPTALYVLVLKKQTHSDKMLRDQVLYAMDYENGILTCKIKNMTNDTLQYDGEFVLYESTADGSGYTSMRNMQHWLESVNDVVLAPKEEQELQYDLRIYGKVKPGEYMLKACDTEVIFTLIEK